MHARILLLIRVIGLALIALIASTAPLWTIDREFPAIPLASFLCDVPGIVDVILWYVLLTASMLVVLLPAGMASEPEVSRSRRIVIGVILLTLVLTVCLDQIRLQPWVWHVGVMLFVLMTASTIVSARLLQWIVISIYLWSAISKLDLPFVQTHGQTLVNAFSEIIQLDASRLPDWLRFTLAALMPVGELTVGLLLILPQTIRCGLWLSIGMHISLIVVLGPFGLDQRPGVLIWNVLFIIQNLLLFGTMHRAAFAAPDRSERPEPTAAAPRQTIGNRIATAFAGLLIALPVLEVFNALDAWPAWAVYSAHVPTADVYVSADARQDTPVEWRRFLKPAGEFEGRQWLVLDVHAFALDSLHAPRPPGIRVPLGVSEELSTFTDGKNVLIAVRSRVDRMTGQRDVARFRRSDIDHTSEMTTINTTPRSRN